jgi:hypothetical protein
VSAVYAPIDFTAKHEEVVRAIVQQECPGVKISIGKEVANIGAFLYILHWEDAKRQVYWNVKMLPS